MKKLLISTAVLSIIAFSPAFAGYVPVNITGAPASEIGEITLTFGSGDEKISYRAQRDDDDQNVFAIDLDDAHRHAVQQRGVAEIVLRDGTVINGQAQLIDGRFIVQASAPATAYNPPVRGGSGGPGTLLDGMTLSARYHTEWIDLPGAAEGGTVVMDNGGVFSDAGVNQLSGDHAFKGFQVSLTYTLPDRARFEVDVVHATNNSDFQGGFTPSGGNETIGFAFYQNDPGLGSGLGGLDGVIDTTGFVEQGLDRLSLNVAITMVDLLGLREEAGLHPLLGFTHEEVVRGIEANSILTSPFGTLTQSQSIWETNESLGPDIGLQFETDFGASDAFRFYVNGKYQPRWNDVDIVAEQAVSSQIGFFPADVMQIFEYNNTHFYHGFGVEGGVSCTVPFFPIASLSATGGFRSAKYYGFAQESDGFGRPATLLSDRKLSSWISVGLTASF